MTDKPVGTNPFKSFSQHMSNIFADKSKNIPLEAVSSVDVPITLSGLGESILTGVQDITKHVAKEHSSAHSSHGHAAEHSFDAHSSSHSAQQHQQHSSHNSNQEHSLHSSHSHGEHSSGSHGSHGQYQMSPYFEKAVEIINTAAGIIVMASVILAGVNLILVAINANFGTSLCV